MIASLRVAKFILYYRIFTRVCQVYNYPRFAARPVDIPATPLAFWAGSGDRGAPGRDELRVERRVARVENFPGRFLVIGHEVAQFLGGDVGALVLVLGGQDGRGGFGFGGHNVASENYRMSSISRLSGSSHPCQFCGSHGKKLVTVIVVRPNVNLPLTGTMRFGRFCGP